MLTLLKTKIVHLFPLLNQETLCYEPDSFLFHTQNQQFFENDIMELFSSTYPLRLNKRVPPPDRHIVKISRDKITPRPSGCVLVPGYNVTV